MPFNLELRTRTSQPKNPTNPAGSPFLLWNGSSPKLTAQNKPVTFFDVGSDVNESGRTGFARKVNVTNGGMAVPSATGLGSKFVAVLNYEVITAPSATRVLLAGKTTFSQTNGFMLYASSANAIGANGGDSSGFPSLTSTGIFAVGSYGTIAAEFDGISVRVYKDGRYLGAMTLSSPAGVNAAGLGIGAYTASSSEGASGFRIYAAGFVLNGSGRELSANPWQLFEPEEDFGYYAAASGGSYTLTADSGSFALTGQDAGLSFNRVLAADTQSYTLTGQAAGLAFNRTLAAESGSFSLNGQDAGLAFNRVLSADNGSFALDGQDVTLTYTPISGATYTLGAASGSFALTGQDTGLAFNRVLAAETQSYSLDGQTAGLAFNRVLIADTVSYALTGQDVTLTYTTNGNTYTLSAESGTFELTGQDAVLRYTRIASEGGGGWLPQTRRKSRKQIYEERVKLGILPPPVIKAAAKVAAVAQTVEEFREERPRYEEMFLKAIKKTEWLPDYTRAIQAQLAIMEQDEEELLLLL